jgi:hypothetical protein
MCGKVAEVSVTRVCCFQLDELVVEFSHMFHFYGIIKFSFHVGFCYVVDNMQRIEKEIKGRSSKMKY